MVCRFPVTVITKKVLVSKKKTHIGEIIKNSREDSDSMAARGRIKTKREESTSDQGLDALEECDESTAEEIHALIELEKDDFISLEEYAKRRGLRCARPDSNAPGGNKHKLDV